MAFHSFLRTIKKSSKVIATSSLLTISVSRQPSPYRVLKLRRDRHVFEEYQYSHRQRAAGPLIEFWRFFCYKVAVCPSCHYAFITMGTKVDILPRHIDFPEIFFLVNTICFKHAYVSTTILPSRNFSHYYGS